MISPDKKLANDLGNALDTFSKCTRALPGIAAFENSVALTERLLESRRTVKYIHLIREKAHSPLRIDPSSNLFDPLKAAALQKSLGNIEEACWLVFLATHFGKNKAAGWQLVRDIYGALGSSKHWTWERISKDPDGLNRWLSVNYATLVSDGIQRNFGSLRKYETLRPSSSKGTGLVIASYVQWISEFGSHVDLFRTAADNSNNSQRVAFRFLYNSMDVLRFGRTAKFDYLTMLAKLQLAYIEADSTYLKGAPGLLRGAKLLFEGNKHAHCLTEEELDDGLIKLADYLSIGMQEIGDALYYWQKAPGKFSRSK